MNPQLASLDRFARMCWLLLGIILSAANLAVFIQHNQQFRVFDTSSNGNGNILNLPYNSLSNLDKHTDKRTVEHIKQHNWNRAIKAAKEMLAQQGDQAECLHPRIEESKRLLNGFSGSSSSNNNNYHHHPSGPYLNLGFPKCGSSTLFTFFLCLGYTATHFNNGTGDFEGVCMRDAVANGLPPLRTCARGVNAILQMDVEYPLGMDGFFHMPKRDECFFPQLSILEELHQEKPNATFFMSFRPILDWIKSISDWGSTILLNRFQLCNFPNLPRGVPQDLENSTEVEASMKEFWCSHVIHVRNFVKEYPSHILVETNLYDSLSTGQIMYGLFPTKVGVNKTPITTELSNGCWGHSNANRPRKWLKRKKKRRKTKG